MYENEYLAHYGVKGMKWGVRRFQNDDGSLTNAGKRKVSRAEYDAKKIANAYAKMNDHVSQYQKRVANGGVLSDQELKTIERKVSKVEKLVDRVKKKYENTPLRDITISEKVQNGKVYTAVLMGRVNNSPYDGSPRYLATAGSWTKSNNGGNDRFIDQWTV